MPGPTAEQSQQVRGYIIAQAAKLSIPELVAKVRNDVQPLREAAFAVPAVRFAERPAEGDWSAAEVFTHVLEMNEHGAASIEGIIATRSRPPAIADLMTGESRAGLATAADYWAAFSARRESLLATVLASHGDEHPEVTINHPWFGDLSWREWFLFMRVHDLDHTRQIQAIAAAFTV